MIQSPGCERPSMSWVMQRAVIGPPTENDLRKEYEISTARVTE